MAIDEDTLKTLLNQRSETLRFEFKEWIDPKADEGKAKIAKGCLALRNNNGGYLVIGVDNAGNPVPHSSPADVPTIYHPDVIQLIVTKYAAESFSIEVAAGDRDGRSYAIIEVPPGVISPCAAKSDLHVGGKPVIRDHAIYVRSVRGGVVSSTDAQRGDWPDLIKRCFDNRESDIGGFVRRQLSGLDPELLARFSSRPMEPASPSSIAIARGYLNAGRKRFREAMADRGRAVPEIGFREAAVVIDGEVPAPGSLRDFLRKLFVAQPQHTGWPAWLDSSSFNNPADRQRVYRSGWEALHADNYGLGDIRHLDYWRIHPRGRFYLISALEDDLEAPTPRVEPRTQLEFVLQIWRVAEIISVALAFGRAMGCKPETTSLAFAFRWSDLGGRRLSAWANPSRFLVANHRAHQESLRSTVSAPLDTPQSAIASHVETALKPLFALFGGTAFESRIIEDITGDALGLR